MIPCPGELTYTPNSPLGLSIPTYVDPGFNSIPSLKNKK
jgi:hypothetical protein